MRYRTAQFAFVGSLVVAIGFLVVLLSHISLYGKLVPQLPVKNVPVTNVVGALLRADLAGSWQSAPNDFEQVDLELHESGVFFLRSQFVGYSAIYTGTGTWNVGRDQAEDSLILKFDTPVTVAETEAIQEQYASWGQYFKSDTEVWVTVRRAQDGAVHFFWDGVLIEKLPQKLF